MKTLAQEITIDERNALTFADISRILSARVKGMSVLYVDLEVIKGKYTESRLIGGHDCACILITARRGNQVQRHWTVLLKIKNHYEFFDSLGLSWTALSGIIGNTKLQDFLTSIRAVPSKRKLQAHIRKIRTCGCWAAIRCAKYKLTNAQFVKWVTSVDSRDPDRTVVSLCYIGLLT